jgi:hypothetical protein
MEGLWGICGPISKRRRPQTEQQDKRFKEKQRALVPWLERRCSGSGERPLLGLGGGGGAAGLALLCCPLATGDSKLRRPGRQTNRARCRGLSRPRLAGIIGPKRQADKPATKRVAVPRNTAAASNRRKRMQVALDRAAGEVLHHGLGGSCEWRWAGWNRRMDWIDGVRLVSVCAEGCKWRRL